MRHRGGIGSAAALAAAAAALVLAWAAAVPAGASASACTDEFVGVSGGSWSTPSNWSAGVPDSGTHACWTGKLVVVDSPVPALAESVTGGGALRVAGPGSLTIRYIGSLGAVEVRSGALVVEADVACTSVLVEGGAVADGGILACPVTVGAGGMLSGSGEIQGPLLNSAGTVGPGDEKGRTLSVSGTYTQGATAKLFAGPSNLRVSGAVSLAGTLDLEETSRAEAGDKILAIQSASPAGSFSAITGGTGGVPWAVSYGPEGVLAQVVWGAQLLTPVVEGTATVGSTLACRLGVWRPQGTVALQWLREGAPISGATSATYVPVAADVGSGLACAASVTPELTVPVAVSTFTFTSPATAPVPGTVRVFWVQLFGRAAPGARLTCRARTTAGAALTYRWQRDGILIQGAQGGSYLVAAADEGHAIRCILRARWGTFSRVYRAPARRVEPLALYCAAASPPGSAPLALLSARASGRGVVLSGVASPFYAGARVLIVATGLSRHPLRIERPSVVVAADGLFTATVPLPAADRRARARYVAVVKSEHSSLATSAPIALPRLLRVAAERSVPGGAQVDLGVARGAREGQITVERLEGCVSGTPVASLSLSRGDLARVLLESPAGRATALYRITVTVGRRSESAEIVVPSGA